MDNVQPNRRYWTSACLLALACVTSSGCAKLYHAVHYNPMSLAMHDHVKTYYHSEKTGRIIAKDRCYIPEEPPCYGYEPTCWSRWPADCPKCPVDCDCETDEVIISEQVVATPGESVMVEPQVAPDAEAETASEAALDEADNEELPGDASIDDGELEPIYDESAATPTPQFNKQPTVSPTVALPAALPNTDTVAKVHDSEMDEVLDDEDSSVVTTPKLEQPRSIFDGPSLLQPHSILNPTEQGETPKKDEPTAKPSDSQPKVDPPQERRSSRRKRSKLAATSPTRNKKPVRNDAVDSTTSAEIKLDFTSFDLLATSDWTAKQERIAIAVPSFRIPVKSDRNVKVASDNDTDATERLTTQRKANVSTVSFR